LKNNINMRIMNRTTKVAVALIVAAGLSTMVYAVPEQRALAWGGGPGFGGCGFGCGGPSFGGCGFGCGGGFFGDSFRFPFFNPIYPFGFIIQGGGGFGFPIQGGGFGSFS
jgi:hypothetical protein